jgi:hypothetical protein
MRLDAAKRPPKYYKTPIHIDEDQEKVCKEESKKNHGREVSEAEKK